MALRPSAVFVMALGFGVGLLLSPVRLAADHQRAAAELVRVVRPGGRIALASWTATGFVGGILGARQASFDASVARPNAQPRIFFICSCIVRDSGTVVEVLRVRSRMVNGRFSL